MSLYGMMRTGVSGMNAQANRLSTVADNIANSSTTGYKRASAEFSSLLIPSAGGNYTSGGVNTTVRNSISQQGDLKYTTSGSDLAINGDGFFVVQDANGSPFLTRAGSFVPDAQGRLVNAAGFYLMGYSFSNGTPSAVVNGFGGLEPVTISQGELTANPSTEGRFTANLPANLELPKDPLTGDSIPQPADWVTGPTDYFHKTSMIVYDNVGNEVLLDVYFAKTDDNTWEVAVFNSADATGTPFPYSSGPLTAPEELTFDPTTGKLDTTGTPASATDITFTIPSGAPFTLDLSKMSELGTGYTVVDAATLDGSAPSAIERIEISADGTIYAQYQNGSFKALYRIPIATVQSPDQLTVLPGNIYSQGSDSGDIRIGFPNESGMGSVISGALENSTVDIAEELTNMIESQRSYTANSKVFQTGADLMDVLVNLKR